ncbi:hypothetical protein LOD99_10536 [Oopsacas minuta]|uniref:Piwi domain-containing protein n=1 Tax=Oopsacas minuta TaxID=111878 RepID=A0AAV7KHR7_9METZ|nr:hypothetical protein LOD99_10536 [Oopsacas minuta]
MPLVPVSTTTGIHCYLYPLVPVFTATCIHCYLYPLLSVSTATAIHCYLCPLLPVSTPTCIHCYLYPLLPVSTPTCIHCCLYPLLPVLFSPIFNKLVGSMDAHPSPYSASVLVQQHRQEIIAEEACSKLEADYKPGFTFVIVQKRYHTRPFCPEKEDQCGKSGNIPAGTTVLIWHLGAH